MRTNIVLDDHLVKKALKLSGKKTKRDVVHLALKEYVQNHLRRDIRDLIGKVEFGEDYDHKKLR